MLITLEKNKTIHYCYIVTNPQGKIFQPLSTHLFLSNCLTCHLLLLWQKQYYQYYSSPWVCPKSNTLVCFIIVFNRDTFIIF